MIKNKIMALKTGEKTEINGFTVEYASYGIVVRKDGKWIKDFQRF